MAKPDMGTKRQCQSCGTKFFDMNRETIICPKCGTVYQAAPRTMARAAAAADDEDKDTDAADLVPLEDADVPDDVVAGDDDVEVEDDDSATDAFLEEEEEDGDDVAGLIDSDIETDEEA